MSALLVDPTVVLSVGGTVADREHVHSVVVAGAATDAVDVTDATEVGATLDARDDVGCVVVIDADEATFPVLRESVRSADARLPIVALADADATTVAAVGRHAGCRFLPRSIGDDVLRETVDDALTVYDERRQTAADSSVLRTLLAEGQLSVFAKDERGRYLRMADVAYTMDPDEIRGKTDVEAFGGEGTEASRDAFEDDLRVVETGEPVRDKVEQYGDRGGDYWSEATKIPWYDDGDVRGLVGYALDVTDRMQCERKLEEQRDLFDEFARYVAHDLRSPVQVSSGALELARDGDEGALDKIEQANRRIEEILDDLSSLARGNRSDTKLSEEVIDALDVGVDATDLPKLVENVWRINGTEGATLDVDVPPGTEVVAGTEALRPLVENLLKNAIDHAGPEVSVRVGTLDRGFYVEDDGPGIPEDARDDVLEDGYTTSEDGTGTGFTIVASTVDQEDWELTVTESDYPSGARIEITDCPVVLPVNANPGESIPLSDNVDVGDVSVPGEATYDSAADRWTVVGDGRDIWYDIDEFHFVHADASNPVRVEGRLSAFDGVHEYSKAGLMVRDGLDDDAPFGFVGATEDHGTETMWRERRGGAAASDQFEEPYGAFEWYRIDAVDGVVTLSFSRDGDEWHPLDRHRVELGDSLAVGLVVCSHSEAETSEATFEDVSVCELDVE